MYVYEQHVQRNAENQFYFPNHQPTTHPQILSLFLSYHARTTTHTSTTQHTHLHPQTHVRTYTQAESPYQRATYRYTPLLAYILLPNAWLHPAWGKMVRLHLQLIGVPITGRRKCACVYVAYTCILVLSYYLCHARTLVHCRLFTTALWFGALVCARGAFTNLCIPGVCCHRPAVWPINTQHSSAARRRQ